MHHRGCTLLDCNHAQPVDGQTSAQAEPQLPCVGGTGPGADGVAGTEYPVFLLASSLRVCLMQQHACRPDRSYLISGGLGGLGLVLAAWLAQRGRALPGADQPPRRAQRRADARAARVARKRRAGGRRIYTLNTMFVMLCSEEFAKGVSPHEGAVRLCIQGFSRMMK